MATVTHIIYSHYDPEDRERLERETGQLENATAESWITEPPKYKKQGPAPRFVAATSVYDIWDITYTNERVRTGSDTVKWYRSLRGNLTDEDIMVKRPSSAPAVAPEPNSSSAADVPHLSEKRDKNNWFIMNAMKATQSESSSSRATPKPPTLAEILARDPPPKPNERKYTPPVWLEIGPGNKGFVMLQKSGWSEGEALGPEIVRRKRKTDRMIADLFGVEGQSGASPRVWGKGKEKAGAPLDVNQVRQKEVIDLTWSDSGSDGEHEGCFVEADDSEKPAPIVKSEFVERELHAQSPVSPKPNEIDDGDDIDDVNSAYERRALLTPLATRLKSDRLGIGLKAKTVGPYKESKKRVTHNAAALAAHNKGAEELRKQKNRLGRGRKGFERQYKKDAMKREVMLAYMNS